MSEYALSCAVCLLSAVGDKNAARVCNMPCDGRTGERMCPKVAKVLCMGDASGVRSMGEGAIRVQSGRLHSAR